jgi:hypothetical protein
MLRYLTALVVVGLASAASAQVFFPPPPPVVVYNPFYENLNPQAIARLRALSDAGTFARAYGPAMGRFTGCFDEWGNPLVIDRPPLESGLDPQTGQPLFYRKADLMPPKEPRPQDSAPAGQAHQQPPTTRPAGQYPPGTIIIKPARPQDEVRVVGR